jgi:hypothetical protein
LKQFLTICTLCICLHGLAQSTNASLNEDYYHWIDRYETKAGRISPELFTTIKPYQRQAIVAYADSLSSKGVFQSRVDLYNLEFLKNDSWEWSRAESSMGKRPVFKSIYKKKSDFLSVDKEDFDLHVNPVLYFSGGKDSRQIDPIWTNTRGIEIRGTVDKKIGFYTFFFDNQSILPQYVTDQIDSTLAVPHEGFWKGYKEGVGKDFLQSRAYISFKATKSITLQFGQDRTFIGNGYRSLIFSDFSAPNLFLRANVKIWKINYLYQLNRLTARAYGNTDGLTGTERFPQKFFAFHHASINIGQKFNVGLFESVIFSPSDSTESDNFDFSYLNPIIFYRAVEQQFGSKDNVLLGIDFKWLVAKKFSLYGQFVLDEFVLSEFKSGGGWWGNKYGFQAGAKWFDVFGASNLDWQVEMNVVRPYTYSHSTPYGGYSNYNQPLAHPAGANFNEFVSIIRYQPIPRLNVIVKTFLTKTGRDAGDENWGWNVLKDNSTRNRGISGSDPDTNNRVGQGNAVDILYFDFTTSYMLKHNLFIDFKQVIRKSDSPLAAYNNNTSLTSLTLRLNIAQRSYEF